MIIIGSKFNSFRLFIVFYCLSVFWVMMSFLGCKQPIKITPPERAPLSGDVTLLWNEIPGADAYNVYVSDMPGVTKASGYKIQNVTNPFRVNQLKPGKTYFFVVTVINASGESQESKELAYYSVAEKIGLIYWKSLFDEPIQNLVVASAEKGKEIEATPEREELKSDTHGDNITADKIASFNIANINLQQSKEKEAVTGGTSAEISETSKSAAVPVETGRDRNATKLEEMRLRAAQMLTDSHFYIFFEKNSNELSPKAIEKLDRIHKILAENSGAKVNLNGYSDSSGAAYMNQMVSEVRANSVKGYLSGKGIKPSRIMAFGHGARNSLASNNSEEGRRLNRRVEIELIMP